ncbi:hypothetical protein ASF11_00750 [Acidovorax sp. Leaf76]|uniref:ChaN family lipoprotein n=1 Tax=unclassified Acidovorax TaxID=2684926 RepID=UPI0007015E79|nr:MULTISPECIES: ChaN family lipoprotein [unclassified Acidovorax]KQO26278.1 hypothetical protein ASF11_00750 [Acidovorax sp. Leaf76]KQS38297.1 hypothetical protein ASG27_23255 [Acidovorax sp. Leaf191]
MHTPPSTFFTFRRAAPGLAVASLALLGGCTGLGIAPTASSPTTTSATAVSTAAWPARLQALLPADVLLLGEKHDAAEHQQWQRDTVQALAARGQLAAVVMEMAEQGHSTTGLPRDATEAQVQAALQWKDAAWPWKAYGPVVMAAVAAGVPVWGGNLPRARMRDAMADAAWDRHLPAPALQRQYEALREGHCGLLPESQIAPMARIQIARDAAMARTATEARVSGQTVLLIAGGGHVLRSLGVPTHLPAGLTSKVAMAQAGQAQAAIKNGAIANVDADADAIVATPALPAKDHCAELREQWGKGASPAR